MDELKKLIEKKRAAFAEFDKLPKKEQEKLRAVGMDPHEPKATRELKKAAALNKRKKAFDKLPKEQRDILTAIGWSPYDAEKPINRSKSYYEQHGSYLMDQVKEWRKKNA